MTFSNPLTKWRIEIGNSSSRIISKNTDPELNPPGYIAGYVASQKVNFTLQKFLLNILINLILGRSNF